ncbi:MAG: methylmalonyl Co-A mutase-associated GTPase MeaB, partial [Gammaproteobacteria bacterium]
ALARAITAVENRTPESLPLLRALFPHSGKARIIGLTGAPGAGKSTLVDQLAREYRKQGNTLGIIAVDPTSPFSGGAILGDRIRLDEIAQSGDLYMRSLASRTRADGLTDNLPELLHAMEAAGFEEILLETVGVGQVEHAVRSQVDTLVLVLMPGTGDSVQAMKAGLMELADILVVNKADLAGTAQLVAEIKRVQQITAASLNWRPPVIQTTKDDLSSFEVLSETIDRHQQWLQENPTSSPPNGARARYRLKVLLERRIAELVATLDDEFWRNPLPTQFDLAVAQLGANRR